MKEATLKQAGKVLEVIGQKEIPCEQLQRLLGSGLLSDLLEANLENSIDRNAFRTLIGLKPLNSSSRKLFGTVFIPATTKKFVARDKFVVNTGKKALVKISYLGNNFQNWFLGKIEEPAVKMSLRYAELVESSVDGPILAELGDTAETTLAQMHALMERQKNGENGALLNNGHANIFYVRDINGRLRAMYVRWRGDGWDVGARSVAHPDEWCDGYRVFSCDSCDA